MCLMCSYDCLIQQLVMLICSKRVLYQMLNEKIMQFLFKRKHGEITLFNLAETSVSQKLDIL